MCVIGKALSAETVLRGISIQAITDEAHVRVSFDTSASVKSLAPLSPMVNTRSTWHHFPTHQQQSTSVGYFGVRS